VDLEAETVSGLQIVKGEDLVAETSVTATEIHLKKVNKDMHYYY
jgi:hypothetical protein